MITIYDWFGYELPKKERYRLIKESGFDGVLMWWSEHLAVLCPFLQAVTPICQITQRLYPYIPWNLFGEKVSVEN